MSKTIIESINNFKAEDENLVRRLKAGFSLEQKMEILAEVEGYVKVPVGIDTFIDDPFYLGKKWGGVHKSGDFEGQPKVWPVWRNLLREVYFNPVLGPAYQEICITGSIGIGKSAVALLAMLYDTYRLLLLRDPQQKYGIGEDTPIVMALFSATKSLSDDVLYQGFISAVTQSPFFKRFYHRKPNYPNILFPHDIGIVNGSQQEHVLSKAVFSGVLDEANFGGRENQVLNNYNQLKSRMASRFIQPGGGLPGTFWVCSSKRDVASFLEEHINENRNNPKIKIVEISLWEAQAHQTEKWSGATFPVFAGDSDREPMILVKGEPIPSGIDATRVIDVPAELADRFETDLLSSLRDLAGVSTTSKFKLFRAREQLNNCLILPSMFRSDTIMLSETDDNDRIQNYLTSEFYNVKTKGIPHFIHLDAALGKTGRGGDRFGMAMCHAHSTKEIRRVDHVTGKTSVFQELVVMVDFALGLEARPGMEVPFFKVREFIVFLREMGFNLGSVNAQYLSRTGGSTYDKRTGSGIISTDGWQSVELRQLLRKQGFETRELSVDKTKEPYIAFKRAVIEERVYCPKNKILEKELLHVEDIGKKIEHPEKYSDGTKGCFVGDTMISLVDGREVRIQDLVQEHRNKKINYVYTVDEQTLKIVPKKILSAHVSKNVLDIIEITLDNHEKIRCTPDHKFMLRNGSYCEAQYLTAGVSLMPLYRKVSCKGLYGYRLYYNIRDNAWHYEHRQFCEDVKFEHSVVHHKDYKKLNNNPSNLQVMSCADHRTLHNRKQSDTERQKRAASVKQWHEMNRGTIVYAERSAMIIKAQTGDDVPAIDLHANKDGIVPYLVQRNILKLRKEEIKEHRKEQRRLRNIERQQLREIEVITKIEHYFKHIEIHHFLNLLRKIRLSKFVFENIGKSISDCTLTERIAQGVKLAELLDSTIKIRRIEGNKRAHRMGKFENAKKALAKHNDAHKGVPRSEIDKQKMREGIQKNKEKRKAWCNSLSVEERSLMYGKSSRGKPWYNDGTQSKQFGEGKQPDGWIKGRIKTWKNHKVLSVEKIRLPRLTPVYDLTIEDNPNFALTAGVFVHNSKDISDAVVGCVWSCMENAHSSQLYSDTMLADMRDYLNERSDFWSEKNGQFIESNSQYLGNL